jgi:hypothetical protein
VKATTGRLFLFQPAEDKPHLSDADGIARIVVFPFNFWYYDQVFVRINAPDS